LLNFISTANQLQFIFLFIFTSLQCQFVFQLFIQFKLISLHIHVATMLLMFNWHCFGSDLLHDCISTLEPYSCAWILHRPVRKHTLDLPVSSTRNVVIIRPAWPFWHFPSTDRLAKSNVNSTIRVLLYSTKSLRWTFSWVHFQTAMSDSGFRCRSGTTASSAGKPIGNNMRNFSFGGRASSSW